MLRFQSLDGWRGIAAVFVALYHLNFLNHLHDWTFLRNSYLFVDFFFVLSGFVITHAYKDRLKSCGDITHFISRRLSRLLPLHLFILALFVVLELLKLLLLQFDGWNIDTQPFTADYSIPSLVSNVFLVHSLGIHDYLSWNYPSWSISVEFYTYIIFAIVGLIGYKLRNLKLPLYTVLIVASFYMLYTNTQNLNDATYHFGIFRCIIGFFLGSICYRLFRFTQARVIPYANIVEIALLIFIYYFVSNFGKEKLSIAAPIIFTLTVYIFAFEQGIVSRFLTGKVFQDLGKWSYSIYMLHALVILVIGRSINFIEKFSSNSYSVKYVSETRNTELLFYYSPYLMDILTIFFIAILIFLSSLTYKYIEMRVSPSDFFQVFKRAK